MSSMSVYTMIRFIFSILVIMQYSSRVYCQQIYTAYSSNTGSESSESSSRREPEFGGPITNVTVALGREAKLSCIVDNIAQYRVGWMRADTQTILSLHNVVVTHNTRISVTHDPPQTWNLHIRQVKESDRGCYMCQINTATMKKTLGCIDVHVPPNILDSESSGDVTVGDGGSVSLVCSARGYPKPNITWKREDGDAIVIRRGKKDRIKVPEVEGPVLNLTRVNRRQMGAYQCIANNGVPPAVVKRIVVNVEFAPSVNVINQLVGSPLGGDLVLKCVVEAWPRPITFWKRADRNNVILDGPKHSVSEERSSDQLYRTTTTLTIHNLEEDDYATYTCAARNSLSTADGQIRTYKIEQRTTKATAASVVPYNGNERRGQEGRSRANGNNAARRRGDQWSDRYSDSDATDRSSLHNDINSHITGFDSGASVEVARGPAMDPLGGHSSNRRHEYQFFDDTSAAGFPSKTRANPSLTFIVIIFTFSFTLVVDIIPFMIQIHFFARNIRESIRRVSKNLYIYTSDPQQIINLFFSWSNHFFVTNDGSERFVNRTAVKNSHGFNIL